MIRVIGLGHQASVKTFAEQLSGALIVARAGEPARNWLGGAYQLWREFDVLFDQLAPAQILSEIVRQVHDLSSSGKDVVYLVPGSGFIGDATVSSIATAPEITAEIEIIAGRLAPGTLTSRLQIIDALDLAIAEEQWPFDAGLAPLDSTTPTLVTNLRGKSVGDAALRRLGRVFSLENARPENGDLFIEAADPLVATASMSGLEHIVARLRRPDGCPWDQEQTPASLIPMTLEEIDELREAIDAGDTEEMGDVLLHLILMAQMARESGDFDFGDVVRVVAEKMVRRHPHVFAGLEVSSIDDILDNWNAIKAAEKQGGNSGSLEG